MALAALIVAVVAVSVSVAAFVWSIWQHRQVTTGKLYVRASYAVLLLGPHHERVISLTATNSGMVPVMVKSVVADVAGVSDLHLAFLHWTHQTRPGRCRKGSSAGEARSRP